MDAFSLETSSGLSGTNVTLIFWHISSVVPGCRVLVQLLAPSLSHALHSQPFEGKGRNMAAPSRAGVCGGKIRDKGISRLPVVPRQSSVTVCVA